MFVPSTSCKGEVGMDHTYSLYIRVLRKSFLISIHCSFADLVWKEIEAQTKLYGKGRMWKNLSRFDVKIK